MLVYDVPIADVWLRNRIVTVFVERVEPMHRDPTLHYYEVRRGRKPVQLSIQEHVERGFWGTIISEFPIDLGTGGELVLSESEAELLMRVPAANS